MPQMSPYNWIIMYLLFNFIMMMLLSYNNYMKISSPSNFSPLLKKKFTWKW